ncbi:MAG: hypothetical protein SGI87_01125 [Flavobacteriales bacterium]|nr:hypothetical protein [Flavobacteriales bacterium]
MNKIITVLLVILTAQSFQGQIIDNRLGNAFREEMYFNREFLWQNKVKKITGTYAIKRPNRPIDQRPDLLVFSFNEVGLLSQIDKVTSVLSLVDSLTVHFKRNDLGEVEIRSEKNARGFSSTKLVYEDGKVVRVDFERAENVATEGKKLEAGKSTLINSEAYTYSDAGPNASRKSSYNNYALLYSNEIVTKNELGFIVNRREELTMSGKTREALYTYNDKGWVSRISYTDNVGSAPRTDDFYYDEIGNLLKVEYRESNELLKEIEVLYTETMMIEALLNHDLRSHDIEIIKFQYEYY